MYNELNSKLTANNIIQSINDITNKYGFTDYLNYIIIEKDDTIKRYDYNNIEGLPYYISCESPDEVEMKKDSLIYNPVETPKDLKITKVLKYIKDDLSNLNYYNKTPIASRIQTNKKTPKPTSNYSGLSNITKDIIYRFSGFYMPIFYSIDLFESPKFDLDSNLLIESNYKFDTTLTDFGKIKERKIRKCNHNGSELKLKDIKDEKSVYPMIDEFGYTFVDSFIFNSTWDSNYYHITSKKLDYVSKYESNDILIKNVENVGIQSPTKNISL
jgi:hypothetical protein